MLVGCDFPLWRVETSSEFEEDNVYYVIACCIKSAAEKARDHEKSEDVHLVKVLRGMLMLDEGVDVAEENCSACAERETRIEADVQKRFSTKA